ncbi:MAG: endonuclease/exonuclease/phosphatase family protein [Planctomycetota bacterium]|nr:endonuclease/exonuclease/phosphatase family protein [Planctomycetota bacterium]
MDQPLRRTWVGTTKGPLTFSLLQWNTLADGLAQGSFPAAPPASLAWSARGQRLLEELELPEIGLPDVICLQEVDHYSDHFEPALRERGYAGIFAPKSKGRDGCALFVRGERFVLADHRVLRYRDGETGEFQTQLAILAELWCRSSGARVEVATTHLKARPGFEDLRAAQARQLRAALGPRGACVVAGDFNDVPGSRAHAAIVGLGCPYEDLDAAPEWTTWKIREAELRRTIDYLWYRRGALRPSAVLSIPSDDQVGAARLPSWQYPSDHLSLAAVFAIESL